jgi:hypothetical protein
VKSIILKRVRSGDIARSHDIGRVVHALEELSDDKPWRVTIEQAKSKRSNDANAYYWGVVVEMMSEATGYESEEIHEYLCGARWGWKDKRVPKTPRNPAGLESVPVRTTTTDQDGKRSVLAVMQFQEFVEFARRFAAVKLNLMIPDPDKGWKLHEEREEVAA